MPRICTACSSPARHEIDAALVTGRGSIRGIARQHGLSPDALERHAKAHLPKSLAVAAAARQEEHAGSLLAQVRAAKAHALRLALKAEAEGDVRGAVAGLRVLLDALELLGKVAAEAESNLVESPEWLALRSRIADALEPFPEALEAVRTAVREVEAGDLRETVVVTLKLPDGPERRLFPASAEE